MAADLTRNTLRSEQVIPTHANDYATGSEQFDPKVREFLAASIAPNTYRAYASDIDHFIAWGGRVPAIPQTIARYLADHAGSLSIATLARRLAAIGRAHTLEAYPNPAAHDLVRVTLRGIRRTFGCSQQRVAALTKECLVAITSTLGNSPKDVRDRALLLIGFAGAFRRSELSAIDCTSIQRRPAGVVITIHKSKTDQERRGRDVAIPCSGGVTCPVRALDAWLNCAGITEGPVFRPVSRGGGVLPKRLSSEAVAVIVKQRSSSIASEEDRYSGHSLRAGFVTSAAVAGVPIWKIKAQTGHASEGALGRYIRNCDLLAQNPVSAIL